MASPAAPINFMNKGLSYQNLVKPIDINLNFIVDQANGNGLGIRSLKSNGYVRNVFMHTSATPGSNNGILNPNPAVGYAVIQLAGNFNRYIGGFSGIAAPVGSSGTSVVAGNPYVITSLGSSTAAQFQAVGLPMGLVPAVGQAFIASVSGSLAGGGTIASPSATSSISISLVGDPNQSLSNSNSAANGGGYIIIQFLSATSSSVTTPVASAPANNSVVALTIRLDGSSVNVDGL
jgi:hypothetical protein